MVSRKVKPLGPRQRMAYQKPFVAALREAKERLAAQVAERAAAEVKVARWRKRYARPGLIKRADGRVEEVKLSELSAYGFQRNRTPAERRTARKELVDGTIKLQAFGGTSGAPSLARRVREFGRADLRKLRSIDARIAKLQDHRKLLVAGAYETGVPLTVEAIVGQVMEFGSLPFAVHPDEWQVTRAENALEDARNHDGTRGCPCQRCVNEAQRAAYEASRKARLAAEAKAIARDERKILRKVPAEVSWHCANCDSDQTVAPTVGETDDGPLPIVECPDCEWGELVADVLPKVAPGQEALPLT
jgi:hypothetical protein